MDPLYKYVTAKRVLTCLPEVGDGTLRATQPSALNDPFECAVLPSYVEVSEQEGNKRLATTLTNIHPLRPIRESDVAKAKYEYGSLYLKELLAKQLSYRFGIVSFARNPFHPLLWSHYTLDGAGFVVGYDRHQLQQLSRREGALRSVYYAQMQTLIPGPEVLNEENMNGLLSIKSDHWRYEDEWRLIVELDDTIGTGRTDRYCQPVNLLRVPNQAVKSVYYTERTPPVVVDQVRTRLHDPNNRYGVAGPTKLVMSAPQYGYKEAQDD